MKISKIKEEVLKKIRPSQNEIKKVDNFLLNLKEVAEIFSSPYNGKPMICGSMGKGTWINKDYDIDLFIIFPRNMPREKLGKIGLKIGKEIIEEFKGEWTVKYAEHPYVRGKIKTFSIDIVPCYKMMPGEKIKSAVDRSPLHSTYMIKKLNKEKIDEVRLLKKFFKSLKIYGSDTKTEGISGYILEILVSKFGTFEKVLKFFSKAKFGEIVDVENYWNGKLPKKIKMKYPLIVIDPIDKYRNASAALSSQNFYLIKKYSEQFIKKPDKKFFFLKEKPLSKREIQQLIGRHTYFIGILSKRPDIVDDTIYPQMRRTAIRIKSIFERYNFNVIRKFSWANEKKMLILFEIENKVLPNIEKRYGPEIFSYVHSRQFINKYKKDEIYIEGNRWVVEKKRDFTNPKDLINKILSLDTKKLMEIGIASHIAESFSNANVLYEEKLWKFIKRNLSSDIRTFYFGIL